MAGPLAGIRVLEAGILIQGPQAGALLTSMGAEVTKVELPGTGDPGRLIPVGFEDRRSAVFTANNRGKRSLTLDLRKPDGATIFKALVERTDVVISNFKPGTLDEWGLGFDDLSTINPGLIWAAGSTFGPVGPDADLEGADLAGQAAAGLVTTTGRDGDPPSPVGVFVADHMGSLNMVAGILAALHARTSTGHGQKVEVSLYGGQIWAQATEFTHYLMTGNQPARSNYGHGMIHAIYRIFETADGWIGIIGVTPDVRDAFFLAIDRLDLAGDPRFSEVPVHPDFLDEIRGGLDDAFKHRTTDEWSTILRDAGIRFAPVRSYPEVIDDEGALANGYLADVEGADGEKKRIVGSPIRMSATPLTPAADAPALGAQTNEILREIGTSDETINELRDKGVI